MTIDRKAMTREYKETVRPMGVGGIRHIASNRILLIAGKDLPSLLNRHRAELRLSGHRNRALQQDWLAYGEEAFTFEILDTLEPPADTPDYDSAADLRALEALWMEKLAPYEPAGYHRRAKSMP
jgi:hypothetical protein